MQSYISIGPFSIPLALFSLLAAFALYRTGSSLLYRNRKEALQQSDRILFNILFIAILTWKLSPLLFQFRTVAANPLALLYLPGGTSGLLAGIAASLIYGALAVRKEGENRFSLTVRTGAHLAALLCLFALVSGAAIQRNKTGDMSARPSVGEAAPDFTLSDNSGQGHALGEYRGRKVILNFWASWCPPCRAELPELNAYYRNHRSESDPVFLSVNLYTSEKQPENLPRFIESEGLVFPVIFDTDGKTARDYNIQTIPTTVVIDETGQISAIRRGAVTEALLKSLSR